MIRLTRRVGENEIENHAWGGMFSQLLYFSLCRRRHKLLIYSVDFF